MSKLDIQTNSDLDDWLDDEDELLDLEDLFEKLMNGGK